MRKELSAERSGIINNNGGTPLLLPKQVGQQNHGLGRIGRKCNIDAVGAWVRWGFGRSEALTVKEAGSSFLSSYDPRVVK